MSFSDIMPRPFDTKRDGFAISEGAGILIFESVEHAKQRGADILGYVSAAGISSDAFHPTSPQLSHKTTVRMVTDMLQYANLNADDIDYINLHATGTTVGDPVECQGMEKIFGIRPHLSSTKSMTGHVIGASSALEAIICVESVRNNTVPGTINLTEIDPACIGNHVTETINTPVNHVLSNAFGFGGTNGALIISK
jgi:3-oxoacyl-[acyl-carrier-protein] synthase II